MNRNELADFLRRGRARITPAAVGLTAGPRRRTPGLRREEVAALAGMSVDYYTRLEQSRGPRPSRQTLTALARALRLTEVEHDHLFHLAGEEPSRRETASSHVRPGLLMILDRLDDAPAQILNDHGGVLAQNDLAKAMVGDVLARPPRERNLARLFFLDPAARALFPEEDLADHARGHVASLRAVTAAHPGDPEPAALVAELRASSEEFASLWAEHEVALRDRATKRFLHPVVGVLELECEVMLSHRHRQLLIVHSARPGTPMHEKLRLLRVVGSQNLSAGPARTA
ncbi:helix-turn-helix transcriptional regulator [Streptomyces sp. NPDC091377]|uniref:helix-turn-helix transcriptional regulator n=1 Tax=Streptomyces sp. NPDC091377 TaxID=3365995 RepID=UPI00381A8634